MSKLSRTTELLNLDGPSSTRKISYTCHTRSEHSRKNLPRNVSNVTALVDDACQCCGTRSRQRDPARICIRVYAQWSRCGVDRQALLVSQCRVWRRRRHIQPAVVAVSKCGGSHLAPGVWGLHCRGDFPVHHLSRFSPVTEFSTARVIIVATTT